MAIHFHLEGVKILLPLKKLLRPWLESIKGTRNRHIEDVNYVFCSDDYLLNLNQEYLKHDTLTDIITFDNSESTDLPIEGDIFISTDRVLYNADQHKVSFKDELLRVMAHGMLHLQGLNDKSTEDKVAMMAAEDSAITSFYTLEGADKQQKVPRGTKAQP